MKEKPQLYSHAVAFFHCETITSFTLHNLLYTKYIKYIVFNENQRTDVIYFDFILGEK